MTFKIVGWDPEESHFDETVASIDAWYDRYTKLWVIQKLNKDGYQIGDATYVAGKKAAMKEAAELKAKYGLA